MAERGSRLFDAKDWAKDPKTEASELVLRLEMSAQLRSKLRFAGVRSVCVKASSLLSSGSKLQPDRPRLYASRKDNPKTRLQGLVPKFRRAASARVFQRLAERLALIQPQRVRPVSACPRSLRPLRVCQSQSLRPRSVSSALH